MKLPKPSFAFGLKPKEAIDYLRSKGYKLTFDYTEMMHDAHHKAFTVAKVTRLDLLSDIHTSITDAMENGTRFEDWKKQIIPTLEKKGWWGRKEIVNPKTGEVKEVIIGGKRVRNIFKTNLRVARAKGRCEQQKRSELPYLQYIGGLSEHPRMSHKKKDGIILPKDDPWWQTNYPPNAWGCKCEVRAWSETQMQKRGWSVSTAAHEDIATPDWRGNPCSTDQFDTKEHSILTEGSKKGTNRTDWKKEGMFDLRDTPKELVLPAPALIEAAATKEERLKQASKAILGNNKERMVTTPQEQIIINESLLEHFVEKENRERYANFIVPTLENPLEIWYTRFEDGNIRPQYIAVFDTEKAILVSVIVNRDGTLTFWNGFASDFRRMNKNRTGEWVWKRY